MPIFFEYEKSAIHGRKNRDVNWMLSDSDLFKPNKDMHMYKIRLNELINELESNSDIKIVNAGKSEGTWKDAMIELLFKKLEDKLKSVITPEYIDFFKIGEGCSVYWTNNSEKIKFSGEFYLIFMLTVLNRSDRSQLWHSEMSEQERIFYKSLHTIDIHGHSGDGQFAAFKIIEGQFPPEIWFMDRENAYQMDVDYGSYLDALITTRGLHGWHYFFLTNYDKILSGDYYAIGVRKQMQHVLDGLTQLFPTVDITYYQNKFDEVFNGYTEGVK
jgi:hypothetical protein